VSLSDEELHRYARHIVLPQVGGVGQNRLKATKVVVIGAGGIGSAVIPALAGAGVGAQTIVENDAVDLTNLHRQPMFAEQDEGRSKALLAKNFVNKLNRFVDVVAVERRIDPSNASDILSGHDLVIDGSDNFATRLAVSDCCVALGIPLISAAAMMFQGQVGLFRARPCYRCFVGDAFDTDDCDTCAERGVTGALTATVGSLATMLAINTIVGVGGDQSGNIHLFDGEKLTWRTIAIPAEPKCRACGSA